MVLNVWASWCAPCRAEAPALAEVYEETDRDEVEFVGLATRDSEATAAAFVRKNGLDYPHILDTDGSLQLLFRDTLPPQAIPSTIVICHGGSVGHQPKHVYQTRPGPPATAWIAVPIPPARP